MANFFGKSMHRKFVRPIPPSAIVHKIEAPKEAEEKQVVDENKEVKEKVNMADERLEKIEKIVGTKAPSKKVKVEKKDRGLFERTKESTIVLTEDNQMLLTD